MGCLQSPTRHRQALDWNRPEDEMKCAYRLLDEAAADRCMQPTASLRLRRLMPALGESKKSMVRNKFNLLVWVIAVGLCISIFVFQLFILLAMADPDESRIPIVIFSFLVTTISQTGLFLSPWYASCVYVVQLLSLRKRRVSAGRPEIA